LLCFQGCCKYPPSSEISQIWEKTKDSLLKFLEQTHKGVRGKIQDEDGQPVAGARLKVTTTT
jgi:carboxypeptidase D